jgi:hypothetical protein
VPYRVDHALGAHEVAVARKWWVITFASLSIANSSPETSPILKIEEMEFRPQHPNCKIHFTFRVELKDSRFYAVNFADR